MRLARMVLMKFHGVSGSAVAAARRSAFPHACFYAEAARRSGREVLAQLTSTMDGLSNQEAERRLELFGANEIGDRHRWLRALQASFRRSGGTMPNDENGRKVTVARVAGALQEPGGGILRINRRKEIPLAELVPGDVLLLRAGAVVPADVRLLTATDLFVSQSGLTGEATPVEKFAEAQVVAGDLLRVRNLAFGGSRVFSGSATAVVLKTGRETYAGFLARI